MLTILRTMSKFSAVILLLVCAVVLKIVDPAFLQLLQYKTFDYYQQTKPRAYEDLPVKIIDIDDASLEKIGQWPWPRTVVAELVSALGEAGAAAIVFDIVFAEPDRTSPKFMKQVWKLEGDAALDQLPDHDEILAKKISDWPVVVGSILKQQQSGELSQKAGVAFVGGDPTHLLVSFDGAIENLKPLEKAARGNGLLNSDPDADGVLRKVPLMFKQGDKIYPALSTEALRVAQGAGSTIIKSYSASGGEKADAITAMKIGEIEVPTDANGKFWLYYDYSRPERYIPAWRAMVGMLEENEIAGQIVLIGTSAPGLKDLRTTPLNPSIPGVEVHAQAVEQMLQNISLLKPDWALGAEILLIVIAGLLAFWIATRFNALLSALATLAVLAGVTLISWYAFDVYLLLIEPITAIISVVLTYFITTAWRFAKTERDKSKIRSTFSLYVSENLVNEIAADPSKLKLGGEKKDLTILFCDIRNFSAISEHLDPTKLTGLMNSYLTPMTDIILSTGGTIDKYMGDAIMAIWNAPLDVEGHPQKAMEAALAMRAKLAELNMEWREDPILARDVPLPIRFGMGINSGEASVGNMGSSQRFEYSVLGHEVDLASRLEGLSKYYGVDIVISERTKNRLQNMATIQLDTLKVKGKEEAVQIYAALADGALLGNPSYQALTIEHEIMLAAYRKKHWREVEASIAECRQLAAHVPLFQLGTLYNLYEERVAQFRLEPPPEDWNGIFKADFK